MKKYLSSITILMMFATSGFAQLTLQTMIPSVGFIQKDQLWNVLIVNSSGSSYSCMLNLTLQDRATGQTILAAHSGQFIVEPGAKQQNMNSLSPIEYTYVTGGMDIRSGWIPVGYYLACYTISAIPGKVDLAEECVQFDIEPVSPAMLIFPNDSSQLEMPPTQFSWIPPAPLGMFDRLQYEVIITPVKEGQRPEEAIQQNMPFYSNSNLISNLFSYPASGVAFEKNTWYAWQVVARDDKSYAGKSETWVFTIKNTSVEKAITEQAPFLRMKKTDPLKGVAPNGILKLAYRNETMDSTAQIDIIDVNSRGKKRARITVSLQRGENLIQYDLKKQFHPDEGKIYEAQMVNSRKEKWVVQFEYHSYKREDSLR